MLDRDSVWQRLSIPLDLLVIGGGVTGAAILREAARRNLRAALIERDDFASGASSKSSKLVHGGLRYLREGRFGLTRESVREREELLRDAPGLVEPLRFLLPHYRGGSPGATKLEMGLSLYDLFAGRKQHRRMGAEEALRVAPSLATEGLRGAHEYLDATTDDARLVLRLIQEAEHDGGAAINYCDAEELIQSGGRVVGVGAVDRTHGRSVDIEATVTVIAAGAASDELRALVGAKKQLRPLRGSHLLFRLSRLPLTQAVAFAHPRDKRPVFAYPWRGKVLLGTTDIDHRDDLSREPSISREEVAYLLEAAHVQFPKAALGEGDAVASFAGIRPVIDSGKSDPSKETRDALVASDRGLVTVTGGKLTTFRPTALAALRAVQLQLGAKSIDMRPHPGFRAEPPPSARALLPTVLRRLGGSYGSRAQTILDGAPGEHAAVEGSPFLWAELRLAARSECVVRLDDLLLRRTRIGLLCADGGAQHFERIRAICSDELHWDDERWVREVSAYRMLHAAHYGLPA